MKPIKLCIVSNGSVEATISADSRQDGSEDYFAIVSVAGVMTD